MDFKNLLSKLDQLNEAAKKSKVKENRPEPDDEDYDAADEADRADYERRSREEDGLSEGIMDDPATKETPTGRVHKAKPGGYGRKDDEDDEGKKVKADAPKRGRGRPKKDADETGEVKKYDWSAFGAGKKDVKLPKWDKSKTTKHTLKDWVEQVESKYIAEAEQIQIKPASQVPRQPGTSGPAAPAQKQTVAGQPQKNTQVIQQGNKTLGTVDNPQLAQQIKQSIGKGEMTLMPGEEMAEGEHTQHAFVGGKPNVPNKAAPGQQPKTSWKRDPITALTNKIYDKFAKSKQVAEADEVEESTGDYSAKKARAGKDIGKPGKQFSKIAKSAGEKYGSKERGEKVAGAVLANLRKKTNEADIPTDQNDMGAGLGAGRSQTTLEAKAKPDYIDLDKDGNKKESMKKAAKDKDKKTVKEAAEHRLKAAHHRGKAHALAKENYNCKYDDMEEARMYHEGFKEGLDECYGQAPIAGMVGEANPPVVDDMASFGAHTPAVDEGNAFTAALARTPSGGQFKVGGKSFTDRSGYDSNIDEMTQSIAFEGWEKELNSLLTEGEKVDEGMTVSISKGQQGAPDTVSVSADSAEADQLLAAIKQAGLGLFGNDEPQASSPMSLQVDGSPDEAGAAGAEIGVVDDHDDMMSLIKKMTGGAAGGSEDYADEEGQESEVCSDCGSADCQCDHGEESHGEESHDEEVVDEVESYDQEEEEVAEEGAPDSDAAETTADENAEAEEDQALAQSDSEEVSEGGDGGEASEEDDEETVEESYANSEDDGYEADMNFMMKAIAGGLNKEKSTGQTTIPVVAGQGQRVGVSENAIADWKKLAGI